MPRNVLKHNSETIYVGPAPATGFHFFNYYPFTIANQDGRLLDGNKVKPETSTQKNYNKIRPLSRVQSYSYDFNFQRENVTYLGKAGLHNNPIINKPTVNLSFDYLQNGISNEKYLGFLVNYSKFYNGYSGEGIYSITPCPVSGFFTKETDFRNIFISQVKDYSDVNYLSTGANNINVIAFGNCYIQKYQAQASIGNLPTASVSYICENMFFKTGSIDMAIPAVLAKSGSLISNKGFDLPSQGSTTGAIVSVLNPGDITTSIMFSSDNAHMQDSTVAILDTYPITNTNSNLIHIPFSKSFTTVPVVVGTMNSIGNNDPILGYNICNITAAGFDISLTDSPSTNNYLFHYLAATGDGLLNVGITQSSGISGSYSIPNGVTNLSFVQFSNGFSSVPVVVGSIKNVGSSDPILNFHFSGLSTTGFDLNFTDTIPTANYLFNYFATQNSGSGVGIYQIPSGVNNSNFIQFSGTFSAAPVVIGSIKNVGSGDPILGFNVSGISTSGFYLNFSDTVPSSGYLFNYFAAIVHDLFTLTTAPIVVEDIGYSITDAKLQSYAISLDMQREPLQSIGYVLPIDRRPNQPIFANLNFDYLVGDFETGNFKWQWFHDTEYDITIRLKNPSCPTGKFAGATAIEYSFLKAKINSKNENMGVGRNKTSSVSFITELDPTDLTKGLFISGLLNLNYNDKYPSKPTAPVLTANGVLGVDWSFSDNIYSRTGSFQAWRSTDGGTTYNDAGNIPLSGNNFGHWTSIGDGDLIYFNYISPDYSIISSNSNIVQVTV